MPRISIIIPVYNASATIGRCIESILCQDYKDWELIMVDDGSVDNSAEICNRFLEDKRITFISQKNAGPGAARNAGIELAKGDFITFIDADDYISATYLNDFGASDDKEMPDVIIQGIEFFFTHNQKRKIFFSYPESRFRLKAPGKDMQSPLLSSPILENGCPVAKLFRRELLIKSDLRFMRESRINEDHKFWIDFLSIASDIKTVAPYGYTYYFDTNADSLTKHRHSYKEYTAVAESIRPSFLNFIRHIEADEGTFTKQFHLFGPDQLIKAAIESLNTADSISELSRIQEIWRNFEFDRRNFPLVDKSLQAIRPLLSKNLTPNVVFRYKFIIFTMNLKRKAKKVIKKLIYK